MPDCEKCGERVRELEHSGVRFETEFHAIRKDLDKISSALEKMADMSSDIKLLKKDISEAVRINEATINRVHKRIDDLEADMVKLIQQTKTETEQKIQKTSGWLDWTGKIVIGAVLLALLAKIGLNK